jgi:large subunit ribosomal protein L21
MPNEDARFAAGPKSRLTCLLAGHEPAFVMADYAIISLGGKQYRVRQGDRLLVDRVPHGEGKTFHPDVLLTGGDGKTNLSPRVQVTAKVLGERRGEKLRIGKYRPKKGYRRHTGFRAALSEIEIQSIGSRSTAKKTESKAAGQKPKTERKSPAKAKASTAKKTEKD